MLTRIWCVICQIASSWQPPIEICEDDRSLLLVLWGSNQMRTLIAQLCRAACLRVFASYALLCCHQNVAVICAAYGAVLNRPRIQA